MKKCLLSAIILCAVSFSSAWAADAAPSPSGKAGDNSSASMQQTVSQLQKQIQSVSDSLPQAMKAITDNNQQSLKAMQVQIQAQLDHLQSEIDQIEQDNAKQLSIVQKEVQDLSQRK